MGNAKMHCDYIDGRFDIVAGGHFLKWTRSQSPIQTTKVWKPIIKPRLLAF